MPVEHWQAQGISRLFGKSVLVYKTVSQCLVSPSLVQICTFQPCQLVPRSKVWHFPLLPLRMQLQRAVKSPFSLLFSRQNSPTVLSFPSQDVTSSPVTSSVPSSRPFQGPQHPFYTVEPRTSHNIQAEAASTLNIVHFDQNPQVPVC